MSGPRFPDGAASRAVLIGAGTFQDPELPDIPAVRANLDALRRTLTHPVHGVFAPEYCVVVDDPKDPNTVGAALSRAVDEAEDLLLVYYCGHGLLDDGVLHFALTGTDPEHVGFSAIHLDLVKRTVGRARAKARVLVLDCCFSGQAVSAMAGPSGLALGQLNLTGTYTLTSTTATAPSHAPPGAAHTAFTGAMLQALTVPGPLTLDEVHRYVDKELAGLGLPRPQRRSVGAVGDLSLVRGPARDTQAAADPDQTRGETEPNLLPERPPELDMSGAEIDRRMDERIDLIRTDREQHGTVLSEVLEQARMTSETAEEGRPRSIRRPVTTQHARASEPAAGRRKANPTKSGKKKVLVWTGGILAFLLVGGSTVGYLVYENFDGSITAVSTDGAGTGGFSKDRTINVLVIGTDKRVGKGNEGYGNADTNILFHVSKDRTNATALSIPRNLITNIPDCPTTLENGKKNIPGTPGGRFGTSLGQYERTPSCTMRTVTELTGIRIDHFMVADSNAVKTLTTAVGGVDICLAKDINDKDSHLKLSKGEHTIQGEQALAFLRTRHSVGSGDDLSLIEIQQLFMGSLMRKLKSNDTLTSRTKMRSLAEAAAKALTVDNHIGDINQLRELGMELASVDPKNITFTTVPVLDDPDGKTSVTLDESKAPHVFSMLREDVSFTEVKKKEKAEENARLKGEMADPADVRVDVYNGGAPVGSSQSALVWLQNEEGVRKSANMGNAADNVEETQLVYAPNQADQARRLADLMGLPAAALKPTKTDAGATEPMVLTLGPDFTEAGTPLTAPDQTPAGQQIQANEAVCVQ
ncbi:LCP family protein [Streptomyces sp. NPDC002476]|uniref:caspase, EACC1-associated type n=1 Tax=Streptomyces sp. NPDC002476 TaxID=3364648 RepID=UPI0036A06B22